VRHPERSEGSRFPAAFPRPVPRRIGTHAGALDKQRRRRPITVRRVVVFHTYILASVTKRLYVGVTNDLARRLEEHRTGARASFVGRYNVTRLVHVEASATAMDAIRREKELKGWSRAKKIALVERSNPQWLDLTEYAHHGRMLE
jgi:putative endonuclease